MNKKISVITFTAQVSKVTTLIGSGLRVVLDMPESAVNVATQMMECKRRGTILEVAAVPVLMNQEMEKKDAKEKTDSKNKSSRRRERYPYHD